MELVQPYCHYRYWENVEINQKCMKCNQMIHLKCLVHRTVHLKFDFHFKFVDNISIDRIQRCDYEYIDLRLVYLSFKFKSLSRTKLIFKQVSCIVFGELTFLRHIMAHNWQNQKSIPLMLLT